MLLSELLWTIPIFHGQLVDRVRDASCYSVSFDECMNRMSKINGLHRPILVTLVRSV